MNLFGGHIQSWQEHWVDMPAFHPPTRNTALRNKIDVSDVVQLCSQPTSTFPKYPIYIISKGRSDKQLTARSLDKLGIDYKLVIEPQELEEYSQETPIHKILLLPFSNLNQGSIPARNFVLQHSQEAGHKRHWILDDNINGFGIQKGGRRINTNNGDFFAQCENFVDRYQNIKIAGIRYRFHHNYHKAPFFLNTRIYSCILIDNSISHQWRGKYNEDTDLSLRVLKDGDCTLLFTWCYCNKQGTLTMKGGNAEIYNQTNERYEFAEELKRNHPDHVEIVRRYNRWHHEVNYEPFKKNKLRSTLQL
jgi:hypothetical protein